VPPLEEMDREQDAVLWPWVGTDRHNEPLFADKEDVAVRWVERRTEMRDPQGGVVAVDVTAVVDRVIAPGSRMGLGTVAEYDAMGTGTGATGEVLQVVAYAETADLRGRFARRTVGLARFRDALPTGAAT
jgi:hypothetical protein